MRHTSVCVTANDIAVTSKLALVKCLPECQSKPLRSDSVADYHLQCSDITDAVSGKIAEHSQNASLSWQHMVEEAAKVSVIVGSSLMADQEFDGRLAIAAKLTAELRAQVEQELDYTVSAGPILPCPCMVHHKPPPPAESCMDGSP